VRRETFLLELEDGVDHVPGPADGPIVLEYGDYECPFSRQAFCGIERVERSDDVRFAFRHFPLTEIHPRALAAVAASRSCSASTRSAT
jgi:protein-disulfide isomerase